MSYGLLRSKTGLSAIILLPQKQIHFLRNIILKTIQTKKGCPAMKYSAYLKTRKKIYGLAQTEADSVNSWAIFFLIIPKRMGCRAISFWELIRILSEISGSAQEEEE